MFKAGTGTTRLEKAVAYCKRKLRLTYSRRRRQLFWSGTFSPDTDFYTHAAKKLGKNGLELIMTAFGSAESEDRELYLVLVQRLYSLYKSTGAIDFLLSCAKDEELEQSVRKQAVSMLACSSAPISVDEIRTIYDERPLRGILPALLYAPGEERHTFAMEVIKGPPAKFDREYAILSLDYSRLTPEDILTLTKLYDQARGTAMRGALLEVLRKTSGRDLGGFFKSAYDREKLIGDKLSALIGIFRFCTGEELEEAVKDFAELTAGKTNGKKKKSKKGKSAETDENPEALLKRYAEITEMLEWLNGLSGDEVYPGMVYAAKNFKKPDEKKAKKTAGGAVRK